MLVLNNLDALAEQFFKEGISKSEKEAKKLLSDANANDYVVFHELYAIIAFASLLLIRGLIG